MALAQHPVDRQAAPTHVGGKLKDFFRPLGKWGSSRISVFLIALASLAPASILAQAVGSKGPTHSAAGQAANWYEVFFALGSANLTPSGKVAVRDAVAAAKRLGASRVVVVGHADALGSEERNLDLSRRRARAVLAALVSGGLQPATIEIDWRGEFDPSVPTKPDGLASRNRRVTITLEP